LATCFISQDKTDLSSLALSRHLGTSYCTAWLIQQRLMKTMAMRDSQQPFEGVVQFDDAYLGGQPPGICSRGSPNKVPIAAAVSTNEDVHAARVKANQIAGFTCKAITAWALASLAPACDVRSNGLACLAGFIEAGCAYSHIVIGQRKLRDPSQFQGFNALVRNLKTIITGGHKSFKFGKYARQHLAAFAYRLGRRVNLGILLRDLLSRSAANEPKCERRIRGKAEHHDS
jgi:hypothetical protein